MADNTEGGVGSNFAGKARKKALKWGIMLFLFLAVFLVGLVPMWMKARSCANELDIVQKSLIREQITSRVAMAVSDARRGEYESARKDASTFFSQLRTEIDKEEGSAFEQEQATRLKELFKSRDGTITLLAQRDPASSERLTETYLAYFKAIGKERTVTADKQSEQESAVPE